MSRNYVSHDDIMEIARRIREQRGAANGVAPLDESGHVPAANLPSYVDDVLEYATKSAFPATGESGKIYIAADTNMTYRWSGTQYVEISSSLALGETASTAYPGDKGKANNAEITTLKNKVSTLESGFKSLEERVAALEAGGYVGVADPWFWTAADLGITRPSQEGESGGTVIASDWTGADGHVTVKANCKLCRVDGYLNLNEGMGIYTNSIASSKKPADQALIQIRVNGRATIKVTGQRNSDGGTSNSFSIYNEVGARLATQTLSNIIATLTFEYDGGATGRGGTLYVARSSGTTFVNMIQVNE